MWRSMIDEVMFEIREMTGQVYRNSYAGSTAEDVSISQVAHVQDPTHPLPRLVGANSEGAGAA